MQKVHIDDIQAQRRHYLFTFIQFGICLSHRRVKDNVFFNDVDILARRPKMTYLGTES